MTTWVVVADASRARIFAQQKKHGELAEVDDMVHPGARLVDSELTTDRRGAGHGAFGQGSHAMDARTDAHRHEAEAFAREVNARLQAGRARGDFDRLVLMAPPAFLGELRAQLDESLRKEVVAELHKDLVRHPVETVREHLLAAV